MPWFVVVGIVVAIIILIYLLLKWVMDRAQAAIGGGTGLTPTPPNPCPGLKQALDAALQAAENALSAGSPTPADVKDVLKKAQDALAAYKACMGPAEQTAIQVTIDGINAALVTYRGTLNSEEKEIVKDSDLTMP